MDTKEAIHRLTHGAVVIERIALAAGDEQSMWKPASHKWSLREVLGHLSYEEREDFRTRLDYLLNRPGESWPPIDPEGDVRKSNYNDEPVDKLVDVFRNERKQSLEWLGTVESPDWSRAYTHPQLGEITAGSLLLSWVAHDLLHVRQLTALDYAYVTEMARPHRATYAGLW